VGSKVFDLMAKLLKSLYQGLFKFKTAVIRAGVYLHSFPPAWAMLHNTQVAEYISTTILHQFRKQQRIHELAGFLPELVNDT